jgi:hypothetical protein
LIVLKESTEEIAGQEAESALEEGRKHHNLIIIGCGKIFIGGRTPLYYDVIWEKVIHNEPANLAFIFNGCLKHVRVQGSHGREDDSLRRGIKVSVEMEIARKKMRNGGDMRSD